MYLTILSVKQCVRGSFIFKARKLFEKNLPLAELFMPQREDFCSDFQSRPRYKQHFANITTQEDFSLGSKRGYIIFFAGFNANFGFSHKRLS